ncbi:MAG: HEAT repeat domain-containing protein [Anaerolineae bacterium]|jgi:HEAT repeat protein|nr:MAG: HEAT repeat-containing PBS lyase [Chloroflexi bacterium OLB13]MBC6957536.1 HEAT repeat domain-containing protein [Chloroflexota bacterium]MCO6443912.1 HEAT repeat domain-containing protein [Anaerolineae bacterium]MDL1917296.1 HEAT repeat domain-containing protein [Anaerolineae bacterium CFX4]MEB2367299.1 HEAT repeat domain-containing protein [Chloroflexota bacterium]
MPGIEALTLQLQTGDHHQRSEAALALGRSGDPAAIPPLIAALCSDDDLNVIEDVTWALTRFGTTPIPGLFSAHASADSHGRHNIVHVLGKIGDASAAPILIDSLRESDRRVRVKAVYVLGQIGILDATPALIERLADTDEDVRWTAFETITLPEMRAGPALIDALRSADEVIRENAARALGALGYEAAVTALIAALDDDSFDVRCAILEALAQMSQSSAARAALGGASAHPDAPTRAYASALVKRLG